MTTLYRQRRRVTRYPRHQRSDRGEATTQLVILTPILIMLMFLGVQAAIYFHAANVAAAAASQGAAASSPSTTGANSAMAAAQRTIADLGGHSAHPPIVALDGNFVVVSVEISVPRIIPFFPSTVMRRAVEPRERFVPESKR